MPFNIPILLLPLLGGFVFVTYCNRTKWYAVRAEKERLTLYASVVGFIHLVIAWVITSLVPHIPCVDFFWCFSDLWATWHSIWKDLAPFPYIGTALLSFILASVSWIPLNRYFFDRDTETERIIVAEGGPLEQLLDHAMHTQKHVLVTLKNDKIYIGVVDSSFTPGQLSRTIRILPTKSGFRDSDKKVIKTVHYDKVYEAIGEDFRQAGRSDDEYYDLIEDFLVVVSLDDIASISLYWEEVDARYFSKDVAALRSPLPTFETEPLPVSEKRTDPILRVFEAIGDFLLQPVFLDSTTKRARLWRIGWGIGTCALFIINCLYLLSN